MNNPARPSVARPSDAARPPASNGVHAPESDETRPPVSPRGEQLRRLLERAIFSLLVALVLLAAAPYGSVDPWWEGVFEGGAFALGALWMIEGALGGRWLVREHRLLVPLVALIAFAVAQTLPFSNAATVAGVAVRRSISADPFETWRFVCKFAALVLCAAMWLRYTTSPRRLRALVYALIFAGWVSALFGVWRRAAGGATVGLISTRLAANLDGFAQFINRNHFAFLAEMSLGLVLSLLVGDRRGRGAVLLYTAAALTIWAALVLSNSRAGLLGMFAQLSFVALIYTSARAREATEMERRDGATARPTGHALKVWFVRAALVLGLLAAVLVGVVWLGGGRLGERLENVSVEMTGAPQVRWGDRRVEIWGATWRMIAAHPLAGVGFGAYRAGITAYHDASGEMSLEQAHNDYLELLASGGLIGAALVMWFAFAFIARSRSALRSIDPFRRAVCTGALGGVCAVLVHSLFDFGLHVTANALVCAALIAVSTADVRHAEKKTRAVKNHARHTSHLT